jgi:anti-sigma B factor antagonist
MHLTTREEGDSVVVVLDGELDLSSAPELREALVDLFNSGHHQLVVDMQGVTFVDSTGLGVLVGGLKRASVHDGALHVVCTDPDVLRIFRMTGLHKLFQMHTSLDAALTAAAG